MRGGDKKGEARTPEQTALDSANICAQCGACMAVCPVYRIGRKEDMVARGKLRLIKGLAEGLIPADRHLQKTLGRCLLCGRCSFNCPNFTPAKEGVQAGRAVLAAKAGVPFSKKLVLSHTLPQPRRMDTAAKAGYWAQAAIPADSGLLHRLTGLQGLERLPRLARQAFLGKAPTEIAGPKGAPRVAFFAGCVANYMRPELAERAVALLAKRFNVVIPPGQGCCGLPAIAAGLSDSARQLAKRHLALLGAAKADLVVTACGSCAHTLSHELPVFLGQAVSAVRLGSKVREISQVLAEEEQLLKGLQAGAELAGPVAVHDPCHLKIGMGVSEEPRKVLQKAGVELVAMNGADQCCGGGGLFAVNEPELSEAIFQPRAQGFAASGAKILATSCSGCAIQWRRGLAPNTPVIHPIELLDV